MRWRNDPFVALDIFWRCFPVFSFFNWISTKFLPLVNSPRCRAALIGVKNAFFSALGFAAAAGAFVALWCALWM